MFSIDLGCVDAILRQSHLPIVHVGYNIRFEFLDLGSWITGMCMHRHCTSQGAGILTPQIVLLTFLHQIEQVYLGKAFTAAVSEGS